MACNKAMCLIWRARRCAACTATHAESQLVCCVCVCRVCVCVACVRYVVSWCGCVGVWGEQVQEDLHWQVAVAHAAHSARHHGRVRHYDVPRPWQRRGPVLPHPLRLIVFVQEPCSLSGPPALSIRSEGGVRGEGESVLLGWGVSWFGFLWGLGGAEGSVRPSAALVVS